MILRTARRAHRLWRGLLSLILVSILTFLATNVLPYDPARIALGRGATEAQIAAYAKEQGLDKPAVPRYVHWVGRFVQGDWGKSTLTRRNVRDDVAPRLRRSGTLADLSGSLLLLLLNSLPEFVIGLFLLVVCGVWLEVLPVESSAAVFGTGWEQIEAYILPIGVLVAVVTPYMTRMVRVQVREALGQPYVRTAILRGVPPRRLMWRHIAPNASVPVVNVVALNTAELLGGLVVVETVCGFPGLGQLLVESVQGKDIPTVQAIALLTAIGFVVMNALADAIVLTLNPKLREM